MRLFNLFVLVGLIVVGPSLSAETESVLIPVVIDGEIAGALGSRWVSTITAYNNSDQTISYTSSRVPCSILCPPDPSLAPGQAREVEILPNQSGGGMYLVYDLPSSGGLVINARIQDISRAAMTWGTELPVIPRERFQDQVVLVTVPTDPRFRSSLRVYGHFADDIRIRILDQDSGSELSEVTMRLSAFGSDPLQAFVPDIVAGVDVPEGRIVTIIVTPVDPANRIWAFSSITNNETQHVTLVTPQP